MRGNTSRELRAEVIFVAKAFKSKNIMVGRDGNARYSVRGMIVPQERIAVRHCGTKVVPRFSKRSPLDIYLSKGVFVLYKIKNNFMR